MRQRIPKNPVISVNGIEVRSRESIEETRKALDQMEYRARRFSFLALKNTKTIEVTSDLMDYDHGITVAIRKFREDKKQKKQNETLF